MPPTTKKSTAPAKKPPAAGGSARADKRAARAKAAAAAEGGPAAVAATYLKERHGQKKAVRSQKREERSSAERSAELGRARSKGAAAGARAPFLVRDMPRRALLVEFALCMIIVMAGTVVAPQGSNDGATRMMIKLSGLSALFFVLALVSAGGPGPAKAAGGLGALVTLGYVFTSSDAANLAKWAGAYFSPSGLGGERAAGTAPATARPTPAEQSSTTTVSPSAVAA